MMRKPGKNTVWKIQLGKNRTNKFEKISDAKPKLINNQATLNIQRFEDDFTNIDK